MLYDLLIVISSIAVTIERISERIM